MPILAVVITVLLISQCGPVNKLICNNPECVPGITIVYGDTSKYTQTTTNMVPVDTQWLKPEAVAYPVYFFDTIWRDKQTGQQLLQVDTQAILTDYLKAYTYNQSYGDAETHIIVRNTVANNRLQSQTVTWQNMRISSIKVTEQTGKRFRFYVGAEVSAAWQMPFNPSIAPKMLLAGRKHAGGFGIDLPLSNFDQRSPRPQLQYLYRLGHEWASK